MKFIMLGGHLPFIEDKKGKRKAVKPSWTKLYAGENVSQQNVQGYAGADWWLEFTLMSEAFKGSDFVWSVMSGNEAVLTLTTKDCVVQEAKKVWVWVPATDTSALASTRGRLTHGLVARSVGRAGVWSTGNVIALPNFLGVLDA